ncbi:MAG: hypothetical protein AAFV31_06295 [Pseudomonadota bacterium]
MIRERDAQIEDLPEGLRIEGAVMDAGGAVTVQWAPDGHVSRHNRGWLRSTAEVRWHPAALLPVRVPWAVAQMPVPPTFDGAQALSDGRVLHDWLKALCAHGFARL